MKNHLTSIKIYSLVLLFFAGIAFQACDSSTSILSSDEKKRGKQPGISFASIDHSLMPAVKPNNTLSFDSFEQFGQFMHEFGAVANTDLDGWMEKKLGFASSLHRAQIEGRFATESLNEQGMGETREELVPDPWFASVLSEDGLIEVEGTVFEVGEIYVIIYKDWSAYESYSNNVTFSSNRSPFQDSKEIEDDELKKINDSVYRFKIQNTTTDYLTMEDNYLDGYSNTTTNSTLLSI